MPICAFGREWLLQTRRQQHLKTFSNSLEQSRALVSTSGLPALNSTPLAPSSCTRYFVPTIHDCNILFMCQTADRCVQLLLLRSAEEAKDKRLRRQKRQREKANSGKSSGDVKMDSETLQQQASDWFSSGVLLTCAGEPCALPPAKKCNILLRQCQVC